MIKLKRMQYVVASVKYHWKLQKNTVPKRLTEAFDKVKYPTKVIKTSVCGKTTLEQVSSWQKHGQKDLNYPMV